jgi:hypothetical protein
MRDNIIRAFLIAFLFCFSIGSVSTAHAEGFSFSGNLSNRYKFRTTGDISDHDLETLLTMDFGDRYEDRFSGAFQAGGIFDLDGNDEDSTFSSVYDTFSGSAVGRLYYAYFDAKDLGPIAELRVGRQHRYEIEPLYYDGLTLEFEPFSRLTFSAFGGVPVHLFENMIGFDPGDWLAGTALQWNPFVSFQARFDYVHLKDKLTGFRVAAGDQEDDVFGVTLWWAVDRHAELLARFTSFSDQVRDAKFTGTLIFPEQDWSFRFHFFRLLEGYDVRVIDYDAFGVAGTYEPYTELSFSASKGWNNFVLDGGFAIRFLGSEQTDSPFNHGYERVYLAFSLFDVPVEGFSLTATGDYYHGEDNVLKNNVFGGSLDLAQEFFNKRMKISGGTAFYLYRFNLYSGNESNNVQVYFANLRGKIIDDLEARVGYEFEDNDFNGFHSVDARLIWSF